LKVCAALSIAIAACSGSSSSGASGATGKQAEHPVARESAAAEVQPAPPAERDAVQPPDADGAELGVGDHRVQLQVRAGGCRLASTTAGAAPQEIDLELRPPCFILPWNRHPARGGDSKASSDAVAVGEQGDPMAYRYPSAGNATAIAVIGDPVPDELWRNLPDTPEQLRARKQTTHCASRLQGVVLTVEGARLSKSWISKRGGAEPRLLCTEGGLDEKDFWLLAHDAKADAEPSGDDLPPLPERKRKKPIR
jgi:hypothetical protein